MASMAWRSSHARACFCPFATLHERGLYRRSPQPQELYAAQYQVCCANRYRVSTGLHRFESLTVQALHLPILNGCQLVDTFSPLLAGESQRDTVSDCKASSYSHSVTSLQLQCQALPHAFRHKCCVGRPYPLKTQCSVPRW